MTAGFLVVVSLARWGAPPSSLSAPTGPHTTPSSRHLSNGVVSDVARSSGEDDVRGVMRRCGWCRSPAAGPSRECWVFIAVIVRGLVGINICIGNLFVVGADDFDVRERAAQASQNGADHIQEIGPIGEGGWRAAMDETCSGVDRDELGSA